MGEDLCPLLDWRRWNRNHTNSHSLYVWGVETRLFTRRHALRIHVHLSTERYADWRYPYWVYLHNETRLGTVHWWHLWILRMPGLQLSLGRHKLPLCCSSRTLHRGIQKLAVCRKAPVRRWTEVERVLRQCFTSLSFDWLESHNHAVKRVHCARQLQCEYSAIHQCWKGALWIQIESNKYLRFRLRATWVQQHRLWPNWLHEDRLRKRILGATGPTWQTGYWLSDRRELVSPLLHQDGRTNRSQSDVRWWQPLQIEAFQS